MDWVETVQVHHLHLLLHHLLHHLHPLLLHRHPRAPAVVERPIELSRLSGVLQLRKMNIHGRLVWSPASLLPPPSVVVLWSVIERSSRPGIVLMEPILLTFCWESMTSGRTMENRNSGCVMSSTILTTMQELLTMTLPFSVCVTRLLSPMTLVLRVFQTQAPTMTADLLWSADGAHSLQAEAHRQSYMRWLSTPCPTPSALEAPPTTQAETSRQEWCVLLLPEKMLVKEIQEDLLWLNSRDPTLSLESYHGVLDVLMRELQVFMLELQISSVGFKATCKDPLVLQIEWKQRIETNKLKKLMNKLSLLDWLLLVVWTLFK